jgi:isopenicillin N synthase-like dioxygenase
MQLRHQRGAFHGLAIRDSAAMTAIPLIDVAPLDGSEAGLRNVGRQIGEACRTVGFFSIRNTPIPAALRHAVFDAARQFFSADMATKEQVSIRHSAHNRGYVGIGVEALDPTRGSDLKEAFNMGLDLDPGDPEVQAGAAFRGVNLWPALPGFREKLAQYYASVLGLGRDLHRAIAVELGLPQDYFAAKLDRPLATLRLLHYPAAPASAADSLGAGEHTDYGNLTLLATDGVGGLEVRRRDGTWIEAPVMSDAFICNVGDCLMRWTNDLFVSTPHRVINPRGRERFSVAFFLDPNPEAVVECLPTCTGPDRPARYPPITAAEHLRARLDATYRHRTRQ